MHKISSDQLRSLLDEYYDGVIKEEKAGFKICCPFHNDSNPSCIVFYESGIFFCFVCHGDKKKGHKGCPPYMGFRALGMPEEKAKHLFLTKGSSLDVTFSKLPNFAAPDTPKSYVSKVVKRESWPNNWCFRGIKYDTIKAPWFQQRFAPEKVTLVKERIPRFSMAVGGSEKYKDINNPKYLRHEVYLRIASSVKVKVVNSSRLNLDINNVDHIPATLFGLINNKLTKGCRGVIVVEGPYDCIHAYQHIYRPEIGGQFDVVALLGTPQWTNVLEQFKTFIFPQMKKNKIPLILAFDNDAAGQNLIKTAIMDLKTQCYLTNGQVKILNIPSTFKDVGETPFDIFYGRLMNCTTPF